MKKNDAHPEKGPLTEILVAVIIALLVGSSSPWWWDKIFGSTIAKNPIQSPSTSPPSPGGQNCFEDYFSDVPKDRVTELEEGAKDFVVISRDQNKEGAIGIQFTELGQPIGALKLKFFSNGTIFKILSVIDSSCNRVEKYSVEERPGEKGTLQNWDTLVIQFGEHGYAFSPDYSDGKIRVKFIRTTL